MDRADATGQRIPQDCAQDAEASALALLCRSLTEASPLPMAAVEGPEHLVRAVNLPFCRLIGAAKEAVVGRPFAEAVPAWVGSQALLDRVSRTGAAETLLDQARAHPATGVWSCTVWPVQGSAGRPVGILMVQAPETTDVEQFHRQLLTMNQALVVSSVRQHELTGAAEALNARLAAQNALLETILEQAAEEIVVRDAQGRLLLANAEVRRWLRPAPDGQAGLEGTPLEQAPRFWGDMLDVDEKPIPLDAYPIARALRGERVPPLEIHRVTPDGGTRALLSSAVPLLEPQGALIGAVAISIDITLQKHKEVELRQARDTLELRVQERTTALEQTSDQLRALASELTLAEQRERRRLAQILHDGLQQYLVAAKFRVTLLGRADDPTVRNACQEIQGILDECVASSRSLTSELSPPVLQSGGLTPALEWLSGWMQKKHGLTVLVQPDTVAVPTSEAVSLLLFQSVRELLFNTVKHAQVTMARVKVQHSNGYVILVVSDSGVGFDPQALPMSIGGGFGLFSIRERLQFLGGCMEIASAPGHGCRVTLSAPLHHRRPEGHPTPPLSEQVDGLQGAEAAEPAGGPRKIRVLLVDDHTVVRQGLALSLQQEPDIEIVGEAADGQSAVELARQLHPDVITMDISMPGMDGIEATRAIHAESPDIRIIGLSVFEAPDRAAAIREAGAVRYLTKSGPPDALSTAVRTVTQQT